MLLRFLSFAQRSRLQPNILDKRFPFGGDCVIIAPVLPLDAPICATEDIPNHPFKERQTMPLVIVTLFFIVLFCCEGLYFADHRDRERRALERYKRFEHPARANRSDHYLDHEF